MTACQGFVLYLFITVGLAGFAGALADHRDRRMGVWFAIGLWLPLVSFALLLRLPKGSEPRESEPLPSERLQFAAVRR